MLTTVAWETFGTDDAARVGAAFDNLIAEARWDSYGVYTFWEPSSHELLYVGKASIPTGDAAYRFRLHTGVAMSPARRSQLLARPPNASVGSKVREVHQYFASQPERHLGYSFVLQQRRPGDTPQGASVRAAQAEGALIEIYRRRFGRLPPWNHRRERAGDGIVALLDPSEDEMQLGIACAKSSLAKTGVCICTLAGNPRLQELEACLDDIRIASHIDGRMFWDVCEDWAARQLVTESFPWAVVTGYGPFKYWPKNRPKPYRERRPGA